MDLSQLNFLVTQLVAVCPIDFLFSYILLRWWKKESSAPIMPRIGCANNKKNTAPTRKGLIERGEAQRGNIYTVERQGYRRTRSRFLYRRWLLSMCSSRFLRCGSNYEQNPSRLFIICAQWWLNLTNLQPKLEILPSNNDSISKTTRSSWLNKFGGRIKWLAAFL